MIVLLFLWKPIEQESSGRKSVFLSLLKNYLFNYYGEWYEVSDYYQVNYNSIVIIAQKSIFYNYYYYLIASQVNGILHHSSSRLITREEICSCPSFDIANRFFDYGSTYKLSLKLYRVDKSLTNSPSIVKDEGLKMVVVPNISLSNLEQEEEPGFWETMWDTMWDSTIGTVYFLLSERLQEQPWNDVYFYPQKGYENNIEWREIKSVPGKSIKSPVGTKIEEDLKKLDLDKDENEHFLEYHIKGTLYWRKKQIWQGRYWIIHRNFKIQETVNPAGTSITIFGSDSVLAKVTESVSMKVGGNAFVNKFIECIVDTSLTDDKGQNNRQTERQVISESSKGGGKPVQKETTTKTTTRTRDLSSRNSPKIGSTFLQPHLYAVDHTKCEYTMYQFQHRYRLSGVYPLSFRIEYNQNLLNQYRSRRTLKGKMTYDYFNSMTFGEFLDSPGMLKASIISTNMGIKENWFREKIEAGVNLWKDDHDEFYQKELPLSINESSRGGTTTGSFNIKSIKTNLKSATGKDEDVGTDNMTWVMKGESFCRPVSGGRDIFPDLITDSNGRKFLKMDVPPHSSGSSGCPYVNKSGICTKQCTEKGMGSGGNWRFDERGNWSGKKIKMPKGVQYQYRVRILNGRDAFNLTAKDEECYAFIIQQGATFTLQTIGTFDIERIVGDPPGMPNDNILPATGVDPAQRPTNPFRTNNIGNPNNNLRTVSGSGEQEFNVPDIDNGYDPDFDQGLDTDISQDPEEDPTQDPDKPTDPDLPPDDPYEPEND